MADRPTPPATYSAIDVFDAQRVLDGVVHRTPVLSSRQFDALAEVSTFFKCENLQRTGSFKFRGAYYAIKKLSEQAPGTEVLAYSSGNHAQAVALASRLNGVAATVIMPDDAPSVKREATAGYGARIVSYRREETTREEIASTMAADPRYALIPPYDHENIIAGQGTTGLELLEDHPDLDAILVCCGGGGLISGIALAAASVSPSCKIIGVEPATADDASRTFRTGRLHTVRDPETIADGARTPSLGTLTMPIVLDLVHDMVTVTDAEIVSAMRFLWERMKLVVEPTGALATAAAMSGVANLKEMSNVGVIISGGNVDLAWALSLLQQ